MAFLFTFAIFWEERKWVSWNSLLSYRVPKLESLASLNRSVQIVTNVHIHGKRMNKYSWEVKSKGCWWVGGKK